MGGLISTGYDVDMRDEVKSIIRLAPLLTFEERGAITRAFKAADSLGGATCSTLTVDRTSDEMWVLRTITDYMQSNGLDLTGTEQLIKGRGYGAFRAKVPAITKYLKHAGPQLQQRALLTLGVELLYDDMIKIGLAVTSRSIMAHAHRIPAVINRQFPGYVEAGFLKLVIRKQET